MPPQPGGSTVFSNMLFAAFLEFFRWLWFSLRGEPKNAKHSARIGYAKDFVSIDGAPVRFSGGRFEISGWVKTTNPAGTQTIFDCYAAPHDEGFALRISRGVLKFTIHGDEDNYTVRSSYPVTYRQFHFRVWFDGARLNMLVDGETLDSVAASPVGKFNNAHLHVCSQLSGTIRELVFWSRNLSADERKL